MDTGVAERFRFEIPRVEAFRVVPLKVKKTVYYPAKLPPNALFTLAAVWAVAHQRPDGVMEYKTPDNEWTRDIKRADIQHCAEILTICKLPGMPPRADGGDVFIAEIKMAIYDIAQREKFKDLPVSDVIMARPKRDISKVAEPAPWANLVTQGADHIPRRVSRWGWQAVALHPKDDASFQFATTHVELPKQKRENVCTQQTQDYQRALRVICIASRTPVPVPV